MRKVICSVQRADTMPPRSTRSRPAIRGRPSRDFTVAWPRSSPDTEDACSRSAGTPGPVVDRHRGGSCLTLGVRERRLELLPEAGVRVDSSHRGCVAVAHVDQEPSSEGGPPAPSTASRDCRPGVALIKTSFRRRFRQGGDGAFRPLLEAGSGNQIGPHGPSPTTADASVRAPFRCPEWRAGMHHPPALGVYAE